MKQQLKHRWYNYKKKHTKKQKKTAQTNNKISNNVKSGTVFIVPLVFSNVYSNASKESQIPTALLIHSRTCI